MAVGVRSRRGEESVELFSGGRPARRGVDAVFYLLKTGCSWRMLPREYPLRQTVYYHL